MRRITSKAAGAILAAAMAAPAAAAGPEDGLTVTSFGAWSLEVVAYDGRAACSVIGGAYEAPDAVVTKTDDSDFVVPVFEIPSAEDAMAEGRVAILVDGAEQAEAVVEIGFDEAGALIVAYPGIDDAKAVIDAMGAGRAVSVVNGDEVLMTLPLDGFAEAWRALGAICG